VTATHTSTVYVVGFVALYLSRYILPEDLYPWLGIASGALILTMGLTLLVSRLRSSGLLRDASAWLLRLMPTQRTPAARASEAGMFALSLPWGAAPRSTRHDEEHHTDDHLDHVAHHEHDAEQAAVPHSHGFGSVHSHRIPGHDGERVTVRSLVGLGLFGGMIPCPSAIVVMLSAIALHRVAFGLLLIVAFSLGLAAVLVAIGFALVFARSAGDRLPVLRAVGARIECGAVTSFVARAFPVAAAAAVLAAGMLITLRALAQQGTI
jgi:ABC-type nickel/cobalt efflux system permease component RcnA